MNYESIIEAVCAEFSVSATYTGKTVGPSVTRYEFALGPGVKVSKFNELRDNFAYALASDNVRVLAPIPGKAAVGIELPNVTRETVGLDDIPAGHSPLEVALGKTVDGETLTIDLAKMPHLLVAGTTGSGKSSWINAMMVSLLRNADPERVKMILIDPKMVELTPYEGIPHLLGQVVTEADHAAAVLDWVCNEMDQRYALMKDAGVRHIDGIGQPYIVVVIDELADLMMAHKQQIEASVVRIAQKARAAGIHLVLATQRPSVDVVTGLIKANVPSRLAFAASNATDSRVVLDQAGAEALLGMGDALYLPVGARSAVRVQSAHVTDQEIAEAVAKVKAVHRVDEMVEQLNPVVDENRMGVLEYLNGIIRMAQNGHVRAADFIGEYTKPKRGFRNRKEEAQMELVTKTPGELGAAGDTLGEIAKMLIILRDEAMVEV
jgi:S-DNA-T family DNA segregation ATPase FtsK/SpoIIIE